MPIFSIRSPQGVIIHIQAPDAATAMQGAQQYASQNGPALAARAAANARAANTPGVVRALANGATLGLADQVDGLSAAAETGIGNAWKRLTGQQPTPYNAGQAYEAVVNADHAAGQQFASRHPIASTGATIIGAMSMPGSAAAARFAAGAGGVGQAALRAGLVGAATGAVSGAAQAPPTPTAAAQGAAHGAVLGGAFGAASAPATAALGGIARAGQGLAANAARTFGMAAPEAVATQRIASAVQKDLAATGQTPADLQLAHAMWPGNSTPTLADVAGENTRALMRTAATSGPARQAMVDYRGQVASDLQDNLIHLTNQLTPDEGRSAAQLSADLTTARNAAAATQYREPYNMPVDSSPLISALEGDAGRRALAGAVRESDAMRLGQQLQELNNLKTAANPPPPPTSMTVNGVDTPLAPMSPNLRAALTDANSALSGALPPQVSLGSLDRVKIALNGLGQDAQAAGRNGEAGGYFDRASELDDALAGMSPQYAAARDNYAGASRQIDAVGTGSQILNALGGRPEDYGAALLDMSPGELWAAQNGARSSLADALGAPVEAAQGTANRIATSTNAGRNLAATFGPDQADAYRQSLAAEIERMSNANYMSPNTGSQTQLRGQDSGALGWLNPHHAITAVIGKIMNGPDLTDAERSAIVGQGLSDQGASDPLLAALMQQPQSGPNGVIGYAAGTLPPLLLSGSAGQ